MKKIIGNILYNPIMSIAFIYCFGYCFGAGFGLITAAMLTYEILGDPIRWTYVTVFILVWVIETVVGAGLLAFSSYIEKLKES